MVQPVEIPTAAIGACLNCRQLFLVTPGTPNCLTCGQPPTLLLPFPTAHPEPVEAPEEELPPAGASPEREREETVNSEEPALATSWGYLLDADVTEEEAREAFHLAGADPETAATAVGRLAAVRELIAQLAQPQEAPPSAPAELVSPLAQPAHVAPGAGSPPPQEELDRTNPGSP